MLTQQYARTVTGAIEAIARDQGEKILRAARIVKTVMARDGLIYIFGCGHSHILAEEAFYRAGGLACIAPVFFEPLMLHECASESSVLEKQGGLYRQVLEQCPITEGDALICLSTSGVNAVPVEFAHAVRGMGAPVIAVCSSAYFGQPAGNPLGRHLYEVADMYIDNLAPHGDACLEIPGLKVRMTPLSTVTGAFILNSVLAEAAAMLQAEGGEAPVYLSGNIEGGSAYNAAITARYAPRIRPL